MDTPIFLPILSAIIIGWTIGYFQARRKTKPLEAKIAEQFSLGLNQKSDSALQNLKKALPITLDNIDNLISLGAIFRKRGDLESAIEVHQQLFAMPGISRKQSSAVQLELARDFYAAGLLGRAETLLLEHMQRYTPISEGVVDLLVRLYTQEQDWHKAEKLVSGLPDTLFGHYRVAHANFCCALAELVEDTKQQERWLQKALRSDPSNTRAHQFRFVLYLKSGQFAKALNLWRQLLRSESDTLLFCLDAVLAHCQENELKKLTDEIKLVYRDQPDFRLVFLLLSLGQGHRLLNLSPEQASGSWADWFKVQWLIQDHDLKLEKGDWIAARQNWQQLQPLLSHQDRHYRCGSCGHESTQIQWHCPRCHEWGRQELKIR